MFLFLILLFSFISPPQIFSQEATTVTDKTQVILDKVKQIVIGKETTIISNGPKSLVGTITQIDNNQITVSYKNEPKTVAVTEETVFIDIKRNKTKIDNLKSGQDILAMGYFDQYDNFEAKRIVVTDLKTVENKNEIILGKIVDISQSSPIFVLIPIKNKDNQYQIKTDPKTEILDKDIDKLKSGQKIVVIIQPDPKIAKTFYVSKIITLDSPTAQTPETSTNN